MKTIITFASFMMLNLVASLCFAQARSNSPPALPVGKVQSALDAAAREGKFTFVVFMKGDSTTYRTMLENVKKGVASRSETTTYVSADASAAGEQALIQKFGVGRAPMPLTVAVAPNGAVTGIFSKVVQDNQLTSAIVPPTMMHCMKLLQEQKLVFVCMTHSPELEATPPSGVQLLQREQEFKDRVAVVSLFVGDQAENRLLEQLQMKSSQVTEPFAALIAPPGVLIGHYGAKSTREEIMTAIHKAGKCCDDPNCKHSQTVTSEPTAQTTTTRRK